MKHDVLSHNLLIPARCVLKGIHYFLKPGDINQLYQSWQPSQSEKLVQLTDGKYRLEWKDRDEVDPEPSSEDVVVGNGSQISYTLLGFNVDVALDEVEKQVCPKAALNKELKVLLELVAFGRLK